MTAQPRLPSLRQPALPPGARLTPPALALLILTTLPAPTLAARGTPCDSCETCTEALAQPDAEVALQGPITTTTPGTCITLRGPGATFDGGRHTLTGPGTALRIEAPDAVIRHLRAEGSDRAIELTAPGTTLLDIQIRAAKTAITIDRAPNARLVRTTITGGDIGIAFGASPLGTAETCPPEARLHSPGAVLQRVEITQTRIAIAACEAVPALMHTTLTGNRIGLLQRKAPPLPRDPKAPKTPLIDGPFDPCVCAPPLDDIRPATLLLYSSGCSASEMHASYLPDVRGRGHDIYLRDTARDAAAQTAIFDAHIRRCAPEITDAIGIPGCMPNYACVADGAIAKRRSDADDLIIDHRLMSADDVAEFAARCAAAAAAHFNDTRCLTHAVRNSTLCGNKTDVKTDRPLTGADNRCNADPTLGCAPCDAAATPTAPAPDAIPAIPTEPAIPTQPANPPEPAIPTEPATPAEPTAAAPIPAADAIPATEPTPTDEPPPTPWLPLIALPLGALAGLLIARRRAR